jgi:hypothetical protein
MEPAVRAHQIHALASAAGHLRCALDALSVDGCDWFTTYVLVVLAAIDGQIATLEGLAEPMVRGVDQSSRLHLMISRPTSE